MRKTASSGNTSLTTRFRSRRLEVAAERLLEHDARPAVAVPRQAGDAEPLDDRPRQRGRGRDVEQVVRARAILPPGLELGREPGVEGGIARIAGEVVQTLLEDSPAGVARVALVLRSGGPAHAGAEFLPGQRRPSGADDLAPAAQAADAPQTVERGDELPSRQVPRRTEDDHRAQLGMGSRRGLGGLGSHSPHRYAHRASPPADCSITLRQSVCTNPASGRSMR